MPFVIRLTDQFHAALEAASELIRDEVAKDAFIQLQSNPSPGGGNLAVIDTPNPARPEQTHFMFLDRTDTVIAYRIDGNTVTMLDLLPGGEVKYPQ